MLDGLRAIVYRVPDLDRAKQWYQKVVGKPPVFDSSIVVIFAVGDGMLNLTPADETAPTYAPQAVAYWDVDDIGAAHQALIDPFGNMFGISSKPSTARQPLDASHPNRLSASLCSAPSRPETQGLKFEGKTTRPSASG